MKEVEKYEKKKQIVIARIEEAEKAQPKNYKQIYELYRLLGRIDVILMEARADV